MEQGQGMHGVPEDFERGKAQVNGVSNSNTVGVPQSLSLTSISCKPEYRKQISRVNLIDDPPSRSLVVKIRRSLNCSMALRLAIAMGILAVAFLILVGLYVSATTKPAKPAKSKARTVVPTRPKCMEKAIPRPLPTIPAVLRAKLNELRVLMGGRFIESKATALSIYVYYNNELWESVNLGYIDYKNASSGPPTEDTVWPVASITKVLTAMMMQKLHDEGKIETLDDQAKKYIKDFTVNPPSQDVTLRQLSCMMSGLAREAPCYPPTKTDYCPYTSKQMFANISKLHSPLAPDVTPSYSNLGFAILGDALQKIVYPDSFSTWMKKNIFVPLGMNNSGFDPRNKISEIPITCSKQKRPLKVMNWGWLNAAAGMYSTVKDLAKLASALMEISPVKVFKNTTVRRSLKPVYGYPGVVNRYTQGCPFEIIKNEPYAIYTKSGAAVGYSSNMAFVPDLKLNVNVMVANGGNDAAVNGFLQPYMVHFVNELASYLKSTTPPYKLPVNSMAIVGSYKLITEWPSVTRPLNISISNGMLLVVVEWFSAYLKEEGDSWTLSTVYNSSLFHPNCNYATEATGLYYNIYKFDKPPNPSSKSPGFVVEGITAFGYARFVRIK